MLRRWLARASAGLVIAIVEMVFYCSRRHELWIEGRNEFYQKSGCHPLVYMAMRRSSVCVPTAIHVLYMKEIALQGKQSIDVGRHTLLHTVFDYIFKKDGLKPQNGQ